MYIYTNICCSLVLTDSSHFQSLASPFVSRNDHGFKGKHTHRIHRPNPNSATTDKKLEMLVSACLCGDFRQVDGGSGGGADIYKFSVLLLFCMDFRVGLFIVLLVLLMLPPLFVFYLFFSSIVWDICFTIILLSNSFHQSSDSESTTEI